MKYVSLTASNMEQVLGGTTGGVDKKPSRFRKTQPPSGRGVTGLKSSTLSKARSAYEHNREGKKFLKEINNKIEEETEKLNSKIERLKKKGEKEKIKELRLKHKEKVAKLKSKWDKAACEWYQSKNSGRK